MALGQHLQSLSARPRRNRNQPLTSRESRRNFAASYLRMPFRVIFSMEALFLTRCMHAGSTGSAKKIRLQECLPLFLGRSLPRRAGGVLGRFLPLAGKPRHRKACERRENPETTGAGSRRPRTTRRKGTRHPKLLRLSGRNSPRRIRPVVLRRSQRQDRQARTSEQSRLALLLPLC